MHSCFALLLTKLFHLADDKLRVQKRENVSVWIRISRRDPNIRASKCFSFSIWLCRQAKRPKCCRKMGEFLWRIFVASLASCWRNRFFGISVSPISSWFIFVLQIRKWCYWEAITSCECPVAVYFSGKYIILTLALLRLRGEDCFLFPSTMCTKRFQLMVIMETFISFFSFDCLFSVGH